MKKKEIYLLAAAVLVVLLTAAVLLRKKAVQTKEFEIFRPEQGYEKEKLYLYSEGEREVFSLLVQEKERTVEELEAACEETVQFLERGICGENESLSAVTKRLVLPERYALTGAKIRWSSTKEELVSPDGSVQREGIKEAQLVTLLAVITIQDVQREQAFFVRVLPYEEGSAQERFAAVRRELLRLEEQTREEAAFCVPQKLDGVEILMGEKERDGLVWLGLLLPVGAFAVFLGKKKEAKKEQKKREEELLADYPGLVTKLTMYVGAGLAVRTAWERLAGEYRNACKRGGVRRAAYEELCVTAGELQTGKQEGAAYTGFGERIGLRPYKRLAAVLAGQLSKGSLGMKEALKEEVGLAWETHKEAVQKKGEEAETKLLFPMLGMMVVVFCIVLFPAFYSFGI